MQSKNLVFIFLFIFLLTSVVLGAWSVLPNWTSPDTSFTMSVALADLDNDGDLDLVAGNYNYPYNFDADYPELWDEDDIGDYLVAYEWNQSLYGGYPTNVSDIVRFTETARCIDCIAVADYDKDGDQDIAIGCVVGKGDDGGVRILKNRYNNGVPAWNDDFDDLFRDDEDNSWPPEEEKESYDAHCVRWVDYNCDGNLDLAALEIGGKLHLYAGNGEGNLDKFDEINLIDELDELSFYSTQVLKQPCTTIEFGDIDGDGALDLFVNYRIPYIYKNMCIETGEAQIFTTENIITTDLGIRENCFCASFGWYDDEIALAVGSMTITGHPDHAEQFAWGNDLYTYDNGYLVHEAKSDVEGAPAQLVTDIKWGFIDEGDTMDLVAVSYANITKNDLTGVFSWDRGYEQVHLNPDGSNTLPTDVWTSGGYHDLSTSLALGDIDHPNQTPSTEDTINCEHGENLKALHYLLKFPFYRINNIYYDDDQYGLFENEIDSAYWCYNYDDGWVSIDRTELNLLAGISNIWIKINYSYSTELDLAVGNDGKNAVYLYVGNGGVLPEDPPLPIDNVVESYLESYSNDPYEYETPGEFATVTDTNLMAQDGLGARAGENQIPQLPHCSMFAVDGSWPSMEIFRGHYFWDRLDKWLDFIYNDGSDNKATVYTSNTPEWTIGNYDCNPNSSPPYDLDHRHRTSDERLHTMFVRNLVNRYRPGGLLATIEGNGYNWLFWGATFFQSEFEAQWESLHGYGFSPGSCKALSEKMYFEYQIIKDIDETLIYETLYVISPNSGNYSLGEDPGKYAGTHIPFWNLLNDIDSDLVPPEPDAASDRALWKYCDYIDVSMHCGLIPSNPDFYIEDKDPWISPTDIPGHSDLPLGVEHQLWSFYTAGLDDYYRNFGGIENEWDPPMRISEDPDEYCIKPFFIRDWQFFYYGHDKSDADDNYPQNDWIASQLTKIFSIDVFPDDSGKHFYLVEYQAPWYIYDRVPVFDKCAEMLNNSDGDHGFEFLEQVDTTIAGQPTVHSLRFADPDDYTTSPDYDDLVEFVRTDYGETEPYFGQSEQYVTTPSWNYIFQNNSTGGQTDETFPIKLDAHTLNGDCFQKEATLNTYPEYKTKVTSTFSGGEMGPQMIILKASDSAGDPDDYTQTITLHPGWNLVSWHIWPSGIENQFLTIEQTLPDDPAHSWFHNDPGGKVYTYLNKDQYWPEHENIGDDYWNVNWAYYFDMDGSHNWDEFVDKPQIWEQSSNIIIEPSSVWNDQSHPTSSEYADDWFFMGYGAPGYCKLSSVPNGLQHSPPEPGNPDCFDYEGPFHKLIWYEDYPYDWYDLKIVKDDEGRIYIPDPNPNNHNRPPFDNIGTLQPGRGYFLGFSDDDTYNFEGWDGWPQWEDDSYNPQENQNSKSSQNQTASTSHFLYNKYTHWSYPVYIDTIDAAVCSLAVGDEIGAFDGEMCVGATVYTGEFPLILVCWEDDKATPMILDGYIPENPMTFVWYDASENAEIEIELPSQVEAVQDDPVAPTHSGFGCGLYARRQFASVITQVTKLPDEYKLRQNYPNPFNSVTFIPFELPQRSKVKLEIFNIRGQRLGFPYEATFDAGWQKIKWDASKLTSGIYFYRVSAEGLERGGSFQDTGKLLLLK